MINIRIITRIFIFLPISSVILDSSIAFASQATSASSVSPVSGETSSNKKYGRPSDQQIKKKLTQEQYFITQKAGTEAPFKNKYFDHHEHGIYVDVVTGKPLFSSVHKFDSGSGWPSFDRPLDSSEIVEKKDDSLFTSRTEVRSKTGDSHLGHLFSDGPTPTGKRYCVNSGALDFIPVEKLKEKGYGEYMPLFNKKNPTSPAEASSSSRTSGTSSPSDVILRDGLVKTKDAPQKLPEIEIASFAAGCFWGVEQEFRKTHGVLATAVGYSGGAKEKPTYEQVCDGNTGHAETVEIAFDPKVISYTQLLDLFWSLHDPTTLNRQGPDVGEQYRSVVFYHSDQQKAQASLFRDNLQKSTDFVETSLFGTAPEKGKEKYKKIVTEIIPSAPFWRAEDYHQQYVEKGGRAACHFRRKRNN